MNLNSTELTELSGTLVSAVPDVVAPVIVPADSRVPALITEAGERAILSFVNYFTAEIPNANTRTAYLRAWQEFGKWASGRGVALHQVQPFMVAAYREELLKRYHVRSVKQHLSALRRLFDQMVVDQVITANPAASVRGPKFSARSGVTPILSDEQTRTLFNSIDVTSLIGLRDRAVLSVLVYCLINLKTLFCRGLKIRVYGRSAKCLSDAGMTSGRPEDAWPQAYRHGFSTRGLKESS